MNNKNYKVDLHTHSIISYDGGITAQQYESLLTTGILDVVAITDHNETSFARTLKKHLGEKIIVGEEIMTKDGEIIGLFLEETIRPGSSAVETVTEIVLQGGLVYIPHPFETLRKGMQKDSLVSIADKINILEVVNGRGKWRNKNKLADQFAKDFNLATSASSDSHCLMGIGRTFSTVDDLPNRKNLTEVLRKGSLQKTYTPVLSFLCPVINKVKN